MNGRAEEQDPKDNRHLIGFQSFIENIPWPNMTSQEIRI